MAGKMGRVRCFDRPLGDFTDLLMAGDVFGVEMGLGLAGGAIRKQALPRQSISWRGNRCAAACTAANV